MVEQVHRATVDIYLRDVKETFVGTRRVVARQANDELVGFVSIDPSMVGITIPVVQKTGFAEVAVRPVLTGNVGVGYWVSNITVDPATMTLVGDPAVISQIGSFVQTLPLDISGATGDIVERMPLDLPEGASPVGIQGVLVTVNVESQPGSLIVSRKVVVRGLSPELTAAVSPEEVNVTLFGPLPRLNALADEDVYVYADLVEMGMGQHRVDLTYLVPEGLEVMSISPAIADVEIGLPTPTPYPTATSTPSPTPTPSETITGTPTISGTQEITATVTPTGTVPADRETAPPTGGTPTPTPTLPSPTPVATPTEEKRSS
jgi:YbbR domain-containing protein